MKGWSAEGLQGLWCSPSHLAADQGRGVEEVGQLVPLAGQRDGDGDGELSVCLICLVHIQPNLELDSR